MTPVHRETPSGPPSYADIRSIVGVVWMMTVAHLPLFMVLALSPLLLPDVHVGEAGLGLAVSGYFLMSAVASAPAGHLTQRLGPLRAFTLAGVSAVVPMFIIAGLAITPTVFLTFFVASGLSVALAQPAGTAALSRGVTFERRGFAFGIKHAAVPAASMLSGLAVPILGSTVGWRWALASVGAVAVLPVVMVSRRTRHSQHLPAPNSPAERAPDRFLLSCSAVGALLAAGPSAAALTYLVLSSVDRGLAPQVAGFFLAVGSLGGIVVRVALGWYADRSTVGLGSVGAAIMIGAAGFMLLAVSEWPLAILVGTVLALAAGWGWSGLFVYSLVRRYPGREASVSGIVQIGLFLGGVLGPALFGLGVHYWSYPSTWTAAAGSALAGAVMLVLVGRAHRRHDLRA